MKYGVFNGRDKKWESIPFSTRRRAKKLIKDLHLYCWGIYDEGTHPISDYIENSCEECKTQCTPRYENNKLIMFMWRPARELVTRRFTTIRSAISYANSNRIKHYAVFNNNEINGRVKYTSSECLFSKGGVI